MEIRASGLLINIRWMKSLLAGLKSLVKLYSTLAIFCRVILISSW